MRPLRLPVLDAGPGTHHRAPVAVALLGPAPGPATGRTVLRELQRDPAAPGRRARP
ncbi:MAG TPA: hypothetical protein VG916_08205 [Gemmatimonadaceae bacterium]|nr:hypothetical protein [Gemmatimonadaceae bacterium]